MRTYAVTVLYGQYETYYVQAGDVATAARLALERDSKLCREEGDEADRSRHVKGVIEFCECEQFVNAPISFVKPKSASRS